ncbi:MAG: DUF192 domain-containing protein [Coriobacteriia bacterium]|nr:DUF192 domain-containing protein [Coriobacteriia bacterium]
MGTVQAAEPARRTPVRMSLAWAATASRRAKGLLFSPPGQGSLALFPCRDVHTFGMRYAIDVAFVDARGMVIESHRCVRPLKRMRNRRAAIVVERISRADEPWFSEGDCLALTVCAQVKSKEEGR